MISIKNTLFAAKQYRLNRMSAINTVKTFRSSAASALSYQFTPMKNCEEQFADYITRQMFLGFHLLLSSLGLVLKLVPSNIKITC